MRVLSALPALPASMRRTTPRVPIRQALATCALIVTAVVPVQAARAADAPKAANAPRAALTVTVVQPRMSSLPLRINANGNVSAWQEASIGTESNGLRLQNVLVNVGDVVKRNQVLATFASQTVLAEAAQARAVLAEAEATLAEAAANAQRARELQTSGALSTQQISQYVTAERTAQARLEAQGAMSKMVQLRLAQTKVLAPDNGVISARSATVGAVLPAGQELFRMIRQGRLEWRAEVASSELAMLRPGMSVLVTPASAEADAPAIKGRVRVVAPMVDPQSRNGLVYVDLVEPGTARAGMYARGEFDIGMAQGLTLPQTALQLRDGFSYVLRVGSDSKVTETKVKTGRRTGDRVEISAGLDATARVVASGGGFLADGDTVRVVDAPASPVAAAK